MSGNRRVLTWTLNAGNKAYEEDLEKYGHKIYALGVHEIQVEKTGECYIRRDIPSTYDGTDYGTYRYGADANGDGIPDKKIDKTTEFDRTRSFWQAIEKGMRRWKHINHYLSFILFGGSRVTVMLDTPAYQDRLIERIGATLDYLGVSVNHPNDPDNMQYIRGVEIDFEASMSGAAYNYRVGDNVKYINILKRVKEEICIPRGLVLQVNAYAMWGKDTPFYYRFHDYELFANTADSQGNSVIDELQIMMYDFAWNGSAPGASTPLWWFENVANWAKQCFDSPNAKLKMNQLFFGAAGYGHRWGIYDYNRMYGSTITYRNFIDWQNGLYKHNHKRDDGVYEWHDQEFLTFAAIEDQESKNQILQQHVYDYFKARYGTSSIVNGSSSVRISSYNGGEYATTYSRLQRAEFTNIKAESFAPSSTIGNDATKQVTTSGDIVGSAITIKENGVVSTRSGITGYKAYKSKWTPKTETGVGTYCELLPSGKVTYNLNVPAAGSYRLIALVSFIWYNQAKLGGTLNGEPLTIAPHADYYPLMFKASHWYDAGVKTFNAGANEIIIDGDFGDPGTIIYGFIVCDDFKSNFGGGELTFKPTVKPFKKKDGTLAAVPPRLSVTSKALRQKPIPLMMWEDRFDHYRRATDDEGNLIYKDVADITTSTYYTKYEKRTSKGNGSTLSGDQTYCYDPNNLTYDYGYSWGTWAIKKDPLNGEPDDAYAYWGATSGDGRLLVNYEFQSNMQVEAEIRVTQAGTAGINFGGSNGKDGYILIMDFNTRKLRFMLQTFDENTLEFGSTLIIDEPLPANIVLGNRTRLKAIIHNSKAYFYIGYSDIKAFNGQVFDVSRASGGVAGIYAKEVEARIYMLKVSTTDKWDLMEKFTVEATIDGQKYSNTFGNIERYPEYTIDPNFGYLNYSGINELNTRVLTPEDPTDPETEYTREDISLDYEFFITDIPGYNGTFDIKVIFNDPGIWYGHLYVVDREGGSITWCGDSYSFLDSMNKAVNGFGAKGIGFWTMGQEDPRVFETIPEVVPYHK